MNAPKDAGVSASVTDQFVTVPETTLPNGTVVPAFQVGAFLCSKGDDGQPVVVAKNKPWVRISYHDAMHALEASADLHPLKGTQSLAIAWNIYNQDANWTGGKVGEGSIFMGLHKGTVDEAQDGLYQSEDPEERRWHQLSNGQHIWDFAGNAYSWIFDDIHGDPETGIISQVMPADSPYLTTCPHPSMEKGTGWRPTPPVEWTGYALMRGGCWSSYGSAGVFCLYDGWPGDSRSRVGFRCTKPVAGS